MTGCADEALLPPLQLCALTVRQASLPELIEWRDKLRQEVRVEEQGEKAGVGRDIKVRFGRV